MKPIFRSLPHLCVVFLAGMWSLTAQSKKPEDLAAGKVLVTPRESPDPTFAESVILLVRYSENGAVGLIVNKRTTVPISRALREISGASTHSDPVFVGGPVELDTVHGLARVRGIGQEGATKVLGDVYLIEAKAALEKSLSAAANPNGLRVYLGYCGWGPKQLEREVRLGGWYVFDRSEDLAFDAEPAKLWPKMIGKTETQMVRLRFFQPVW